MLLYYDNYLFDECLSEAEQLQQSQIRQQLERNSSQWHHFRHGKFQHQLVWVPPHHAVGSSCHYLGGDFSGQINEESPHVTMVGLYQEPPNVAMVGLEAKEPVVNSRYLENGIALIPDY